MGLNSGFKGLIFKKAFNNNDRCPSYIEQAKRNELQRALQPC